MTTRLRSVFTESIRVKQDILESGGISALAYMGDKVQESLSQGGKIMFCGNGGSAADAQHLAAELSVRLRPKVNRRGLAAITLAQDSSTMTACGNDLGFDHIYERMILSLGKKGDVLLVISTSGDSENIILVTKAAREMGIKVFGFLGCGGGKVHRFCHKSFVVPSDDPGRIQESHITAGHALVEYVEDELLRKGFIVKM